MVTQANGSVKSHSRAVANDWCKGEYYIAADSEFEGPHTLTVQFAMRVGNQIAVQIYRSPR